MKTSTPLNSLHRQSEDTKILNFLIGLLHLNLSDIGMKYEACRFCNTKENLNQVIGDLQNRMSYGR
jgi:hypothetical protein